MPQLAPMNWLLLFCVFIINFLLVLIKLHYTLGSQMMSSLAKSRESVVSPYYTPNIYD